MNRVVVIGGGVAGLNAARLVHAAGVEVVVLEARDRLGGRVHTVDGNGASTVDGFDLGPSWYWPRLQPAIGELIDELGVASFPQSTDGDVVFERMSREPAQRYPGIRQEHESMRIAGGAAVLVRELATRIPEDAIHTGSEVAALELRSDGVRVTVNTSRGISHWSCDVVIAALPPRILASRVAFAPPVAAESEILWRTTPTWMASQAKFVAMYDEPFWLSDGLSGTAQSMVGPLLEIHDATTASGEAALFGFVGVGPVERTTIGEAALTAACLAQFGRIFGPRAQTPTFTVLKDWAVDPLTSTDADLVSTGHPTPADVWTQGDWAGRLIMAGSETSPHEAGYLAGAVEASARAAADAIDRIRGTRRAQ